MTNKTNDNLPGWPSNALLRFFGGILPDTRIQYVTCLIVGMSYCTHSFIAASTAVGCKYMDCMANDLSVMILNVFFYWLCNYCESNSEELLIHFFYSYSYYSYDLSLAIDWRVFVGSCLWGWRDWGEVTMAVHGDWRLYGTDRRHSRCVQRRVPFGMPVGAQSQWITSLCREGVRHRMLRPEKRHEEVSREDVL